MGALEVILIGIGILIVVISFFIPNKDPLFVKEENNYNKNEKKIKEFLNGELDRVQNRIELILQQTADHAMNNSERMLEKVTNEKIMAISDYSDSVLSQIQKNHDEVVFLYDMMNEKQEYLKNLSHTIQETAMRTENTVNGTEEIANEVKNMVLEAEEMAKNIEMTVAESEQMARDIKLIVGEVNESIASSMKNIASTKLMLLEKEALMNSARIIVEPEPLRYKEEIREEFTYMEPLEREEIKKEEPYIKTDVLGNIDTHLQDKIEKNNHNKKILTLHNKGKTNVFIAKELGLGVGEVKLVIDLFKRI